jgi:dihydroneopterin aldolase
MKSGLSLKDIRLMMHIGHLPEEREAPQAISIDLDIAFAKPPSAFENDQLEDTLCYDQLIQGLQVLCDKSRYQLLEHCAAQVYRHVKEQLNVDDTVFVRITKCDPPIAVLQGGAQSFYGDSLPC